ncbi:uncharacterized protein [Aegilops tauschii subsp. strangulata]|uniref:uncharacterized protein n=1 Tax=Aegilops tauschii subsp. strangulata TaxID=200361 RepID=UPI003CC8E220
MVDLRLPTIESERSTEILKATYSYRSSSSGRQQFVARPEMLTVWRTGVDVSDFEEEKPVESQREEACLETAKMIKEAKTMGGNFYSKRAYGKLVEAQNMLVEESDPLLMTELQDLLGPVLLYGPWKGRSYASSSESSHDRQRFTARGVTRLFATPRMDIYLEQAKKFLDDPTMLLPSSMDDAIKDELVFAALTNNVATREEEMRRLSLFTED